MKVKLNQLMVIFVFLFFCFNIATGAIVKEKENNVRIDGLSKDLIAKFPSYSYEEKFSKGEHTFIVKKSTKQILKFVSDQFENSLQEVFFFKLKGKDYVLTRWIKGAHSEWARIFLLDGKSHRPVWEFSCTWPFEYTVEYDHVSIRYFEIMPTTEEDLSKYTEKTFRP